MAKARDYLFQLKWTEQPQGRAIVEGRATMNGGGSPRGIRLQPEPRLLSRLQLQLFECKLRLPYAVS